MINKIAASIDFFPPGGKLEGRGSLGLEGKSPLEAGAIFNDTISRTIGVLTIVAVIWLLFVLITGAIGYISAGGDKQAVESSRKKIMNALIGFVILISAVFLVDYLGELLELPDILNPAELINSLGP